MSVTLNDQDYTPLGGEDGRDYDFLYYVEPNIRAIFPVSGPTDGGSIVSVWGTGPWGNTHTDGDISEMHEYRCRIGTGPHALTFPAVLDTVDDHALRCVTLEFNATDAERNGPFSDLRRFPLPFSVSLNAQQFTTESAANWTYQRPPKKPLSLPSTGPLHGNTTITVYGSGDELMGGSWSQCKLNLRDGPAVDDDGLPPAAGTWGGTYYLLNATYDGHARGLVCFTGAMPVGEYAVEVTLNGQQFTNSSHDGGARRFGVYEQPTLRTSFPRSGPTDARVWLRLNGTGLAPGSDYVCRFEHWAFPDGDDEAGSGDEGDFGSGDSGSGEAGSGAWSSADNATGADWGHVAAAPWADAAASAAQRWPQCCATAVGRSGASCVGAQGSACTAATMVSDTEVVCRSPRVAPARGARVRLTLNGQQYTDQKVELLFYTPPTLDSEVPPSGGGAGGTSVLVYGSGFTPTPLPTDAMAMAEAAAADDGHAVDLPGAPALTTLRCRFGQVKVPATALSDSVLRCFTPPAERAGARNVVRLVEVSNATDGGGGAVGAVDARGRRAVGRRRRRRSQRAPADALAVHGVRSGVHAELRDGARARDGAPLERRVRRAPAAQLGVRL